MAFGSRSATRSSGSREAPGLVAIEDRLQLGFQELARRIGIGGVHHRELDRSYALRGEPGDPIRTKLGIHL